MRVPKYDLFSGQRDKNAKWIEAIEGLGNANDRMIKIAHQLPGRYFIFSSETHTVVAPINTESRQHQADRWADVG